MIQRIDAIYENGVFRPQVPVNVDEGQRVSLNVEFHSAKPDDLSDIADLLDIEFMESCRPPSPAPTLEEVRQRLSAFHGSLADRLSEERDER